MNICVIGGGNVGTLISAQLTKRNNKVKLYTRNLSKWSNEITVYDEDINCIIKEKIYKITDNLKEAINEAEFIIITIPSFAQKDLIGKLVELELKNTIICFYPGTGGGELLCENLVRNNVTICGVQRICSVARLIEYGRSVKTVGKRKKMYIGCIPYKNGEMVRSIFEKLFDISTELLPNYLNVTLTPSNPILHPSRLYVIFKDYDSIKTYNHIPLFYEDWDNESSELLIKCDVELHLIIKKLKNIDLSKVRPLLEHYESNNKIELTNKIRSITGFKGIKTPSIKKDDKYLPDLESRYFTADIPYGLLIIKDFALITKTKTPNIDNILFWYQRIVNKKYLIDENNLGPDSYFINLPSNYGLDSVSKIEKFYKDGSYE